MSEFVMVFNKDSYVETATQNFKSFLDSDLYIDLIFVCRNNQKVGAHQIVMGCISKLFYSMFLENVNSVREKVIHVYVPDVRAKIMKRILDFVYCGKALLSKSELSEFNEDIKLLGMPLDVLTSSNEQGNAADKLLKKTTDSVNPTLPDPSPSNETIARPSVPAAPVSNNCESVSSSSNTSIPLQPPDIPFTGSTPNFSSPTIINRPPPPGLPINATERETQDADTNYVNPRRTSTSSNVHSTSSNVGLQPNGPINSANPPTDNFCDTGSAIARKRRKTNTGNAVINLVDDDEDEDVITLS